MRFLGLERDDIAARTAMSSRCGTASVPSWDRRHPVPIADDGVEKLHAQGCHRAESM